MDFKKLTYLNVIALGYVLAILAVILNAFGANENADGMNKTGVIFAVLALALSYVHQTVLNIYTGTEKYTFLVDRRLNYLNGLIVVLVACSYVAWLLNSL